ncbi:acyl-CoA thioesterase [Croceicoccus hydrothermalis]|uniref:acyl-CoA thioesterase n=1 Tax=Croceicoccus hydrothermalis TaxID=2867964 RepID=UPI001EFBFF67|nr:acyl-CoA thioesterase II [Croceicoccus hydrothermalis]
MTEPLNPLDDDITPEESVAGLIALLSPEQVGEDRFVGPRKPGGRGRIFGGQVIGQAIAAAQMTAPEGRSAHSLHAYFLRGGDEDHPIDFMVERDFDGGSFSNRRVIAAQKGQPILNLTASFQAPERGLEHQFPMPDVEMPEDLPDEAALVRKLIGPERGTIALFHKSRGFEARVPPMRFSENAGPKDGYIWLRTLAPLPDDPTIHRNVLALYSDYGLLSAALLPHDIVFNDQDIKAASLDHAIWFHGDARMDDWVLYSFDSPWAANARGFTRGAFYTRDGRLIASTAQEGLIRRKSGGSA